MKKYILILALILLTSSVHAITLSNPVSVALGGAYIAKARGFESLHWNPANLGMVENFMTFNLFQVSSDVRNTTLTLGYYNDLMGKLLNEQDKEEFLNKIPESGLSLNANVGTHLPVSMSIGKVAVTFNTMVRSSAEVSKQYFDLILHGNELGVTYDMQGNRGRAVAFLEAKVGYGDSNGCQGDCMALELYRGDIYAGLYSDSLMGVYTGYLARWDGQNWHVAGDTVLWSINALEVFNDELYVGGNSYTDSAGIKKGTLGSWYMPPDTTCKYIKPRVYALADTFYLSQGSADVQFYNNNAYVDSWQWDFGDTGTDTIQNPVHTYTDTGTYNVKSLKAVYYPTTETVSHYSCELVAVV